MFAAVFSAATLAALIYVSFFARLDLGSSPTLPKVALYAVLFLPGLVAAGAFLAPGDSDAKKVEAARGQVGLPASGIFKPGVAAINDDVPRFKQWF